MEKQIFTVLDSVAGIWLEPFFEATIESAVRAFREIVNKEGHQFNRFPQDFALYHIGSFDEKTGVVVSCEPHSLGLAITYVQREELGGNLEVTA